ncbi:hypothetical protein JB92DRAFT_3114490 [Gautieria morchelliformis]|nr:hypothetical protein JB92DRAFT_3114490 [Gautieria morchelliformis]
MDMPQSFKDVYSSFDDSLILSTSLTGLAKSMHEMDRQSYTIRDTIQATLTADTTTNANYARYTRDYKFWWAQKEQRLCDLHPARVPIPAVPITPAKVVMFLNHELASRKQGASGEFIPGTSVGRSVIQGAITALERERCRDAHLYRNVPEAAIPLRNDDRIRRVEASVKHREPERAAKSQTLKAAGSSSDTYTVGELLTLSKWCLTKPTTPKSLVTSLRDRAMHLMCTSTAYRGDNVREIEWSDLFSKPIPNISAGYSATIMASLTNYI